MNNILKKLKLNKVKSIYLVMGLGLVSCVLIILNNYKYRFNTGIDTLSYLSIARQYSDGHFTEAVNGVWSPMTSWILAVFIKIGTEPQVTFAMLNALIACLLLLVGARWVLRKSKGSTTSAALYILIMFPFLIRAAILQQPDLMVVLWVVLFAIVLIYINKKISDKIKANWKYYAALGAVGVIGYFIKLFLLPFFITTVLCWALLRVFASSNSINLKSSLKLNVIHALNIFIIFTVLASPWVAAMSLKYDRLIVGSAFEVSILSRFDDRLLDPRTFLPSPPNRYAVAAGEDRTPDLSDEGLSPKNEGSLINLERIQNYIVERTKAFPFYLNKINSMSIFILPTLLLLGGLVVFGKIKYKNNEHLYILLLMFTVYFAGYALITTYNSGGGNVRYHWPMYALFAMIIPLLAIKSKPLIVKENLVRKFMVGSAIALIPLTSFANHVLGYDYPFSIAFSNPLTVVEPKRSASLFTLDEPEVLTSVAFGQRLQRENTIIKEGDKLVGSNFRVTYFIAYYLNAQVYGKSGRGYDLNNDAHRKIFQDVGIDYFLKFTPASQHTGRLTNLEENHLITTYVDELACEDTRGAVRQQCVVEVFRVPQDKQLK